MTELRADDLKCCGNCEHLDERDCQYGSECSLTGSEQHPLGSCIDRVAPACDKWELHTVIWERIYNRLPKRAEPVTVSEDEYEKLFKRRE